MDFFERLFYGHPLRQSPSNNKGSGEDGQSVAREAAPAAKPQPSRLRLFFGP